MVMVEYAYNMLYVGSEIYFIQLKKKNDDSVKEAPAYCRSFLDGLYNTKEVGDGAKPLL